MTRFFARSRAVPALALSCAAVLLSACGSDDDHAPAPPPTALARVAHLSPDAPAVDFCLRPAGAAAFTGPVLKSLGSTAGLAYATSTRYLEVPAADLTVRLVAPNAADCATPLGGLADIGPVPAQAGKSYTLAATGLLSGAPAFGVNVYADETTVPAGQARLRFVHASPDVPNVDVGAGQGGAFTPLFVNVPFRGVAAAATPNGYLTTAPLANATVSARVNGTTADALVVPGVNLPSGAIATVFAIGRVAGPAGSPPLEVLLCVDNAPPPAATPLLAACVVAP